MTKAPYTKRAIERRLDELKAAALSYAAVIHPDYTDARVEKLSMDAHERLVRAAVRYHESVMEAQYRSR